MGIPAAMKAIPISDRNGAVMSVDTINHAAASKKRIGTKGYPKVLYGRWTSAIFFR